MSLHPIYGARQPRLGRPSASHTNVDTGKDSLRNPHLLSTIFDVSTTLASLNFINMSFGWSAGDIVSGISTLVKVGKALRETGGAASEYQEVLSFLTSVEATLRGLETIVASNPDLALNDELVKQARLLKSAVDDFRKKVDKYDLSLGSDSGRRKVRRIPMEVQFALSEKIKELRTAITQPQLVLDVCINLQTL